MTFEWLEVIGEYVALYQGLNSRRSLLKYPLNTSPHGTSVSTSGYNHGTTKRPMNRNSEVCTRSTGQIDKIFSSTSYPARSNLI